MSAIIPTRQIRAESKSIGPMLGPVRASIGVSTDANAIMDSLDKIEEYQNWSKPSSKFMLQQRRRAVAPNLAERLYDALAEAGISFAPPRNAARSIKSFAANNNICRATVYDQIRRGNLKVMDVGSRKLVTDEAEAAWRKKMSEADDAPSS